jgi:hypothetical protein
LHFAALKGVKMNPRKPLQQTVNVLLVAVLLMACRIFAPAPSTTSTAQPAATQALLPNGWQWNVDSTGQCQVATPPAWQLGIDFFLEAQKNDPSPRADKPGVFPPLGHDALWGNAQPIEETQFQIRQALVISNDLVCSVYRLKSETDFTDGEKNELEEVGQTLKAVQP